MIDELHDMAVIGGGLCGFASCIQVYGWYTCRMLGVCRDSLEWRLVLDDSLCMGYLGVCGGEGGRWNEIHV